jgi:hypothetical protein
MCQGRSHEEAQERSRPVSVEPLAVSDEIGGDPIRIGSSKLLSFTPLGTATSGSIYVRGRDGSQFFIRVLGVTGRVRVQRYVPRTGAWVDGF